MSNAGNKPFTCPSARGTSSVLDPLTKSYLQSGNRYHSFQDTKYTENELVYTEYWFNDSRKNPIAKSGVTDTPTRTIKNLPWVVFAAEAPDEYPRHAGKPSALLNLNLPPDQQETKVAKSNFLFGDLRVKPLSLLEYWPSKAKDPYGAPGPFYNWGHLYQ